VTQDSWQGGEVKEEKQRCLCNSDAAGKTAPLHGLPLFAATIWICFFSRSLTEGVTKQALGSEPLRVTNCLLQAGSAKAKKGTSPDRLQSFDDGVWLVAVDA
jgi:hypothetical protein